MVKTVEQTHQKPHATLEHIIHFDVEEDTRKIKKILSPIDAEDTTAPEAPQYESVRKHVLLYRDGDRERKAVYTATDNHFEFVLGLVLDNYPADATVHLRPRNPAVSEALKNDCNGMAEISLKGRTVKFDYNGQH